MIIIGAGMAGLLAGQMLRRFNPKIIEAQPELPNNHSALLRFRSDAVSIATNIPFKKVTVSKAIYADGVLHSSPRIDLLNKYSQKVTGAILSRSIGNLSPAERYIAPHNYIEQCASGLDIAFGRAYVSIKEIPYKEHQIISTVPMPVMMNLVNWQHKPVFKFSPIWTITATIDSPKIDVYQTIYFPSETYFNCFRASITGDRLILEYLKDPDKNAIDDEIKHYLKIFGIDDPEDYMANISYQQYGKLLPINNELRKQFIGHLSDEYNIYSVGRFATWRQILMDDVVKDIRIVEGFINSDKYHRNKHWKEG